MEPALPVSDPRELLRRVRSWHSVPPLRMDLRFVRSRAAGVFRVCDPATQKFVALYELECLVAQSFDGKRSIADLTEFARSYNPAITLGQIEALVVQLLQLGLLEAEPQRSGHGKVLQLPLPKQSPNEFTAFRNELVLDLHPSEALSWVETTSQHPRAPLFEAARQPSRVVQVSNEETDGLEGDTNLADGADLAGLEEDSAGVGRRDDDSDGRGRSDVPAPQEPLLPETPKPVAPPVTPRQAEAEQESLLEQAKTPNKRWYQRGWVRVLVVLGVLIGVAAVVPYPLYVTSECAIIPNQRAYVRSPIGGVIVEILADEGSVVKKGDVIARLDDRHLSADQRKAAAEVERVEAELQRLQGGARPEEISQLRAVVGARASAVRFAEKEAKRHARMVAQGVGSKQAADEAQGDYQVKRNAHHEAVAALRLLQSGARPEEIAALEAGLRGARAELDLIEQKLSAMVVIRAPIDGVILTPRFRERLNENVEAGGLVCEIADMQAVRAEIFVPERNIDSVEIGMPVVVKVESYPDRPFHGKVNFVAPAVELRGKENVVRVVAVLDNQEGLLRQDMTGYGEVDCGKRSVLHLATRRILRWIRVRFLI